ncbi:CDP-alcohol phosphatidyltransferase [Cryptosporidium felis]|nr:CDP-alcohol phosphatidyltransferase [Cryptosporidium felis]
MGKEAGGEGGGKGKYEYVQPMTSPYYNLVVSPACDRMVEYLPRSLTPNKLTALGLVSVVSSYLILVTVREGRESLFLLSSGLWFLYGVIDNLDGKQARRLGVSCNSGEFLDHAIDSVVTSLVGLSFQFMHNRALKWDIWVVLSYQVPFYFANWYHFEYGKLIIGNSISNAPYFTVDELNLFFIPLFILFEYFIPGLWRMDLSLFGNFEIRNWGLSQEHPPAVHSTHPARSFQASSGNRHRIHYSPFFSTLCCLLVFENFKGARGKIKPVVLHTYWCGPCSEHPHQGSIRRGTQQTRGYSDSVRGLGVGDPRTGFAP